jgi:hypothetical protein
VIYVQKVGFSRGVMDKSYMIQVVEYWFGDSLGT